MPQGPDSFPAQGVNSLASVGQRTLARVIDLVVLSVPYLAVLGIVIAVLAAADTSPEDIGETRAWVLYVGPGIVVAMVYETLCVTRWGQTLGKLVVGIRVARQVNGRCPLWWESAQRVALPGAVVIIPHPVALAGAMALYVVAGFDPMRRNVPDRAAGTVVVRAR